jgi:DMSO/TMAO reductase YedYZ molybdopterin-dependent catalytic subunit
MFVEPQSPRSRIADIDEGITTEELQLAARNHGLPLEALRYDLTPTGLHYTLIHYDIPQLDAAQWSLSIAGRVDRPLTLSLPALRTMPAVTVRVTIECAGNGRARLLPRPISQPWLTEAVGTAEWTGVPLRMLLEAVGPHGDAVELIFTGADHGVERGVEQDYQRSLPLGDALAGDALVAYQMNGAEIPPQHGFPVRLVVPGWYGMAHVKWLRHIEVTDSQFEGFQNAVAYRLRSEPDEPGTAVTRMEPRALLEPPGFPDFMSRVRFVESGTIELSGRAWSGWAPVERVEISVDGGTVWLPAKLDPSEHRWAWQRFHFLWHAAAGEYSLMARAIDTSGRRQPVEAAWNRGGFANNSVQRLAVVVRSR